jgi:hypothetical protein
VSKASTSAAPRSDGSRRSWTFGVALDSEGMPLAPADVGLLSAIGIVFEADGITDLVQQFLGTMLLHGLTPPFARKGFRVHNIAIVGSAQQLDCPLGFQML